ncbi:MAG: VCBS repeat-containing protein [Kofleriaceae bacterium]
MSRIAVLVLVVGCSPALDTSFPDAAPRDGRISIDAAEGSACAVPRFPGWQWSGVAPDSIWYQAADLDGDGTPELLWQDSEGELFVVRAIADGSYGFPTLVVAGVVSGNPVVKDLDGDHVVDIAWNGDNGAVRIARGHGDGTFEDPVDLISATTLNGAFPTLVASEHGLVGARGDTVFIVDSGVVTHWSVAVTGLGIQSIASADLDHDGTDEVILGIADGAGAWSVTTYRKTGAPIASRPVASASRLFVGDLDGDGAPEVIAWDTLALHVFHGDGAGGLSPETRLTPGSPSETFDLVDLDHDGAKEILCVDFYKNTIAIQNLDGTQRLLARVPSPSFAQVVVRDVDGDGAADLVMSDGVGSIQVMRNDGTGAFAPPIAFPGFGAIAIDVRDTDGDGRDDIITLDTLSPQLTIFPQRCAE